MNMTAISSVRWFMPNYLIWQNHWSWTNSTLVSMPQYFCVLCVLGYVRAPWYQRFQGLAKLSNLAKPPIFVKRYGSSDWTPFLPLSFWQMHLRDWRICICEVVTVGDGSALTVAWYGADVHKDRANDKDDWGRFRFTKRFQAHNKTRPVTSTVNKYACGILAYGFLLKKQVPTGGVPMRVIALIKERLTTTTNDVDLDEELE